MTKAPCSKPEPEWVEWAATSGRLTLSDGRIVEVRGGDRLSMLETSTGIAFLDHQPATRH